MELRPAGQTALIQLELGDRRDTDLLAGDEAVMDGLLAAATEVIGAAGPTRSAKQIPRVGLAAQFPCARSASFPVSHPNWMGKT